MSRPHCQLYVWFDYIGDVRTAHIVSPPKAIEFLTNMNEKGRAASPSAIQVKNR